MKKIFEQISLGKLVVKNRLVRSATFEYGGAENGVITPLLKNVQEELAKGGVGLIITGMMATEANACISPGMVRVDLPSFIPRFTEIVNSVHQNNCKIVVQLSHCGIRSMPVCKDSLPLGPSDLPDKAKGMTKEEIQSTITAFGAAALKCKEAGADGVQLHGAHGYLLSQFLSPYFNQRDDEYGGSVENRARILFEVYDEIRTKTGPDYPILIKINFTDLIEPGLNGQECIWVCKELEKRGIDAIELSSGIGIGPRSSPSRRVKSKEQEGYFADGALELASQINIPVISVCGYRSPEIIEQYLNAGNITAVSLCRPLIREPFLPQRWQNGDTSQALCISCNKCFVQRKHGCPFND